MLLALGARAKLAQMVRELVLVVEDFACWWILASIIGISDVALVPAVACTRAKFQLHHLGLRIIRASVPE